MSEKKVAIYDGESGDHYPHRDVPGLVDFAETTTKETGTSLPPLVYYPGMPVQTMGYNPGYTTPAVVLCPPFRFGARSQEINCPVCNAHIMTDAVPYPGILAWIFIILLLPVLLFWVPCCCCRCCMDIHHYCTNCCSLIGKYKRIGK